MTKLNAGEVLALTLVERGNPRPHTYRCNLCPGLKEISLGASKHLVQAHGFSVTQALEAVSLAIQEAKVEGKKAK